MASALPCPLPLLLLLLCLAPLSLAQFPIPHSYVGFVWGPQPREKTVVLEAFYDLTCPSCREGWPAVKEVIRIYKGKLRFVLNPFVLPFHHNSNFAARSIETVGAINSSLAFKWLDTVFDHQDVFSTDATWKETPESVVGRFAALASKALGIPSQKFLATFQASSTDLATRIAFKYGCLRSIVQTPSYFVNGVPVRDADDSWTVADWLALLNPIIGSNEDMQGNQPSQSLRGSAFVMEG